VTSDTRAGETPLTPVPLVTIQQTQPAGGGDGAGSSTSSIDSTSSCTVAATQVQGVSQGAASRLGSEELCEGAVGLVRVSSVRGGVQAALAATVCQTLEL
jgi:hypothetical protein